MIWSRHTWGNIFKTAAGRSHGLLFSLWKIITKIGEDEQGKKTESSAGLYLQA